MQTDALFWDLLVFEGIDEVEVEAVMVAFDTVDGWREVPRSRWYVRTVASSRIESTIVTSVG
ncbi:hypothetical protein ACIRQH_37860 [Streptomyces sp. NPDC102279]|uniref:hypothetical protein n=1 Tax=Streptomyces sp. NPDC102279 TaxID=3366153 RepID=UPI00381A20C7